MTSILPQEENPALRSISQAIPTNAIKGAQIQELIADMKALLSQEEFGVALAAVQVGKPLRLFVVSGRALARGSRNAPDEQSDDPKSQNSNLTTPVPPDQIYINPILLKKSRGKVNKHEGCLSVRGKWGIVPRTEKATIRAFDEHGKEFTRGATGFLAHIFQHEMDHLEGILYTDKAVELFDDKGEAEEK